jgi:acetyl-CoA carboxylase biotin carboxyl carrier protein
MSEEVTAPMAGSIWKILVKAGDEVKEDDELIILEAMKMEIPVYAPADGKVAALKVAEKDKVEANDVLLVLE